jgi:hypothetical protein
MLDAACTRACHEAAQQARGQPAALPVVDDHDGDYGARPVAAVPYVTRETDSRARRGIDCAQGEVVVVDSRQVVQVGAVEDELPVAVDGAEALEALLHE